MEKIEAIETDSENWVHEVNCMISQDYVLITENGKIYWVR